VLERGEGPRAAEPVAAIAIDEVTTAAPFVSDFTIFTTTTTTTAATAGGVVALAGSGARLTPIGLLLVLGSVGCVVDVKQPPNSELGPSLGKT
jgi:hypothetical protein